MAFVLSKVAPRKSSKSISVAKRVRNKSEVAILAETTKALPSVVPTLRRKRTAVPIPSFSPIESDGEENKVDLSIFDTPPDKKFRLRDANDTLRPLVETAAENRWTKATKKDDSESRCDKRKSTAHVKHVTTQPIGGKYRVRETTVADSIVDETPTTINSHSTTRNNKAPMMARHSSLSEQPAAIAHSTKTIPTSNINFLVKSSKSPRNPQPDPSALKMSVDVLFTEVDIAMVTLKDIREAIEGEYDIKLSKANRKLIKERLSDIINGKVHPMLSSQVARKNVSSPVTTSLRSPDNDVATSPVTTSLRSPDNDVATDIKSKKVLEKSAAPTDCIAKSSLLPTAYEICPVMESTKSLPPQAVAPRITINPSRAQVIKLLPEQKQQAFPIPQVPLVDTKAVGPLADPVALATSAHSGRSVRENETLDQSITIPKSVCPLGDSDGDDFDIPGPALSKPPAKLVPSRTRKRARNMPTTTVKEPLPLSSNITPAPFPRATRKRARQVSCSLCVTCPCQSVNPETVDITSPVFGLARNDKEMEKTLIRRVKKLEKTCDKYESDLDHANRELKRYRKCVTKKQDMLVNNGRQQKIGDAHFLPDAQAWDQHLEAVKQTRVEREIVEQAKAHLFSCRTNCQPTLTQMMGVRSKTAISEESGEDEKGTAVDEGTLEERKETVDFDPIGDEESVVECYRTVEEGESLGQIHRLKWNDQADSISTQSPLLSRAGNGVWGALKTSTLKTSTALRAETYVCAWDRVFAEDTDEEGVEELLDLFEQEDKESPRQCRRRTLPVPSAVVDLSMLSQPSRQLAKSIESIIINDSEKHASVDQICPHWKENIRYALKQSDGGEIGSALEHVRESRARIESMKEKMLATWNRQQVVLDLYHISLTESLKRLGEKEHATSPPISQGFFVADSHASATATTSGNEQLNPRLALSPILEGHCSGNNSQSNGNNDYEVSGYPK
jgi:hypothetical protein